MSNILPLILLVAIHAFLRYNVVVYFPFLQVEPGNSETVKLTPAQVVPSVMG